MNAAFKNLLMLALMLVGAGLAAALRPSTNLADERPPVDLRAMLPAAFADWREQRESSLQIVDPEQQKAVEAAYSQTLSRTYVNSQGYRIMLSVAYGKTQRGNLQLHHPEVCYPAQGFAVRSNRTGDLSTPNGIVPVRRLETQLNRDRNEPVTYWATVGEQVVLGSVQRKLVEMGYGFRGVVADGLLFRVSSIEPVSEHGFNQQALFVSDLLAALSAEDRRRIAGLNPA